MKGLLIYGYVGIFLLCATLLSPASDDDDDYPGGIYYPLAPASVLALLPNAPPNWKLTTSRAKERVSYALQPETYAVRQYTFVPPPPLPGAVPAPAPPKTVFISLLDSGNDPERMRPFRNFKAGATIPSTPGTSYSNVLIDGFEAFQVESATSTLFTVKISDRFLLTIRFTNLEKTDRDEWLRLIQLSKLVDASAKAPQTPLVSGPITLNSVDELNPSGNASIQSNFTSVADLKRAQKEMHGLVPGAAPNGSQGNKESAALSP